MSIFNIFKSNIPKTVTANFLDPNSSGTYTDTWTIGEEITAEDYKQLGSDGNVYVLINYEKGEKKYAMLRKDIWLTTKKQFDSIQSSSGLMEKELAKMMKNLK